MLQHCVEFVWIPRGQTQWRSCSTTGPHGHGSALTHHYRPNESSLTAFSWWRQEGFDLFFGEYRHTQLQLYHLIEIEDIPLFSGASEAPRCCGLSAAGAAVAGRELYWREAAGHRGILALGENFGGTTVSFCNKKGIFWFKLFLKYTLEGVKSKSLFIFKVFQLQFLLFKGSVCFLFIYFRLVY